MINKIIIAVLSLLLAYSAYYHYTECNKQKSICEAKIKALVFTEKYIDIKRRKLDENYTIDNNVSNFSFWF